MLTLKAAGRLDRDAGEIVRPGIVRVEGDRIAGVGGPPEGDILDLGELILLPGLMDMEVNLLMGGRGETAAYSPVQDDPPLRMLRAVGNARRTLRAGFTTVRNLGLFVKTGGYLLDVALAKATDAGWIDGPRIVPAGHAITPTGGHLDPTMFGAFAPGVLPLTVEEGIADGIEQVRHAVRYQIKHGAKLIKVCASGGVMSHNGRPGAQHYSDEELRAIVDEAHRRGLRVAAHAHSADAVRAAIEAGVRIAVGTDAPAIPHGRNASELVALASRGMSPLAVLRAATVTAAALIDVTDRGRLAEGLLADVIAVPGDPLQDITVTQDVRFVMKGGRVFVH